MADKSVSEDYVAGALAALGVVRAYAESWRNCLQPSEHTEETVREAEEVASEIEEFIRGSGTVEGSDASSANNPTDDSARLDWLELDPYGRLTDVRYRRLIEGCTVREAIDALRRM